MNVNCLIANSPGNYRGGYFPVKQAQGPVYQAGQINLWLLTTQGYGEKGIAKKGLFGYTEQDKDRIKLRIFCRRFRDWLQYLDFNEDFGMKIVFIRHCEPDYAKDSLTEKGFREAALLADRLSDWKVKDVYCSPLGRARDTAAPNLKNWGKEAVTYDWLREFPGWVVNPFNGKKNIPWDQMPGSWMREERYFDRNAWLDVPLMQTGTVKERWEEAVSGLDEVLAAHGYQREQSWYRVEKGNEDTLVFFCHLGISCVLIGHLIGVSPMVLWHGTFMPTVSWSMAAAYCI